MAGERKFLFLRNVLSAASVTKAGQALARLTFGRGRRLRERWGTKAGADLTMGYLFRPYPRRTQATKQNPSTYYTVIVPLFFDTQKLMEEHWPEAAQSLGTQAIANGNRLIGAELRRFSYLPRVLPAPIFSTAQLNRDLLCPSHRDGGNAVGPSCLTVFGRWSGGALCFPRLRVAFDLAPGDVLMADTRNEQHGNVGPLTTGTRISVVAYLRLPIARPIEG